MVAVSVAWIPIILQMQGGQLFIYIQAISAYLAPPIAGIYMTAILSKRLNEKGAFWSLMLGFIMGLVRMGLDFYYTEPACGEMDTRPAIIARVHYMYFAALLFWLTIIVSLTISYLTKPLDSSRLIRTTFWTRFDGNNRADEFENIEFQPTLVVPPSTHEEPEKHISEQNGNVMKATDFVIESETANSLPLPVWKKAYFWFCGYDYDGKEEENLKAMQEHLMRLSTLNQTRFEKIILNVNLVIILTVGLFLYIFFTVAMPRL
ncbi:Sodium/myo-inositol cotransporter [Chamberlinius hualienensis]